MCPSYICTYRYLFVHFWLFLDILQRLLVVLEESLYIHNIRDMKVIENITRFSEGQGLSQNCIVKKSVEN